MPLPIKLQEMLTQNGGTITARQANDTGISNERLRLLTNTGELIKVLHGIYISPDEFEDKMYAFQLRRPKIIYSHETALFLHDLTDRDPYDGYVVTVPTGYNTVRLRKDRLEVYTIKPELHNMGTVQINTIFGNKVTAYGIERTICDCIRSRNRMDLAIVTDAIKQYVRRKDKDLHILMQMAKTFHVFKPLRHYMEVLL